MPSLLEKGFDGLVAGARITDLARLYSCACSIYLCVIRVATASLQLRASARALVLFDLRVIRVATASLRASTRTFLCLVFSRGIVLRRSLVI